MDGIHISTEELIALRGVARHVGRRVRRRKSDAPSGAQASFRRGRGMDYDESRPYQQGDDVKRIDWRVTARTGHMHTKVYQEETEQTFCMVVDVGAQMAFGTRRQLKSVLAGRFAALVSWLALERGDRIGGVVVSDNGVECVQPSSSVRDVVALFHAMERLQVQPGSPGQASQLSQALAALAGMRRRGASVVVLADLLNVDGVLDGGTTISQLAQCARLGPTYVGCIVDPLEAALPVAADYRLSNGTREWVVRGLAQRDRARHATQFADRWLALTGACARANVELFELNNAELAEDLILAEAPRFQFSS